MFDHPTARQLAMMLQPEQPEEAAVTPACPLSLTGSVSAGVDGLSALLPSGTSSVQSTRLLAAGGHDAVMEVPAARWDVRAQQHLPEPLAYRVRHGDEHGFVELLTRGTPPFEVVHRGGADARVSPQDRQSGSVKEKWVVELRAPGG